METSNSDHHQKSTDDRHMSSGFSRYYFNVLCGLAVFTTIFFILSGYGYNWGIWSLSLAMPMFRITAYMMAILGVLALISLFFAIRSRQRSRHVSFTVIVLLLSAVIVGFSLYWGHQARTNPFIHDVTTDMENPPEFRAVVPLRADAPNPPEYAGEESAQLQREAFPELITIYLPYPKERVYDESIGLIGARGWKLVDGDYEYGIIEATEVLPWFGFKDDVVIRLKSDNGRTVFDMRSKSRVGGTDLGVNAKRIERFTDDLKRRLRE